MNCMLHKLVIVTNCYYVVVFVSSNHLTEHTLVLSDNIDSSILVIENIIIAI